MSPLSRIYDNTRLILRWLLIIVPISVVVGSVVALFLWLLDLATVTRGDYLWLLYLLPVAGLVIVFSYRVAGKNAEAGNNLIVDEIHEPGAGVPGRMAPLVLAGTVVTHIFGGSAGREGTAVHTQYRIGYIEQVVHWKQHMGFNLLLTGKVMLAAVAFGLAGCLFGEWY